MSTGLGELDYTEESLFDGGVVCRQSRRGYRFSVDAVLLAHFIIAYPRQRLLELGAGCGVVSLIQAYRQPFLTVESLEIQPQLCALARQNMEANGYERRVKVVSGDVRQIADHVPGNSFDLVLANPPYLQALHGRLNSCPERAVARHQLRGGLASFVDAAFFALRENGRVGFVYPAAQEKELLTGLATRGFSAQRLRLIHGYPGCKEKLVLVEAVKRGPVVMVREPSLYISTHRGGEYTEEMAGFYRATGGE